MSNISCIFSGFESSWNSILHVLSSIDISLIIGFLMELNFSHLSMKCSSFSASFLHNRHLGSVSLLYIFILLLCKMYILDMYSVLTIIRQLVLNLCKHYGDKMLVSVQNSDKCLHKHRFLHYIEWVSDCCLTPTQQFFSYIMARTS